MLQNTGPNLLSKRKICFTPVNKKTSCPSFLIKSQKQINQPPQSNDLNKSLQDLTRKSFLSVPTTINNEQQLPTDYCNIISPINLDAQYTYKIPKLTKTLTQLDLKRKISLGSFQSSDMDDQQTDHLQINIHSASSHNSNNSIKDNKSFSSLIKSGGQSTFLTIKKVLFQSTTTSLRTSQITSKTSIIINQFIQQIPPSPNDFIIIKQLGKGKTSKVYMVIHKYTGLIYALKIISKQFIKNQKLQQYIFREIKIHHFVKHQNIINLYKCFSDKNNLYLVLQYMGQSSNLYHRWRKQKILPEKQTQKIIADICRAVSFLHKQDIIHRDIKLENILVMREVAKLADLGCAVHSMYMRKSQVGSPSYLSPQQLNNNFYNKKIDVWSIGIIAYELLFGYSPFEQQIGAKLQNNDKKLFLQLSFPSSSQVSEISKDFLSKMLTKNPNDRYTIQNAIHHAFISQYFKTSKQK